MFLFFLFISEAYEAIALCRHLKNIMKYQETHSVGSKSVCVGPT